MAEDGLNMGGVGSLPYVVGDAWHVEYNLPNCDGQPTNCGPSRNFK